MTRVIGWYKDEIIINNTRQNQSGWNISLLQLSSNSYLIILSDKILKGRNLEWLFIKLFITIQYKDVILLITLVRVRMGGI